ncbi:mechanosensitive ion channel [candidate division GN15 bacterium]|nr:mechanosensitive ion channel [candidate division GN15 bacterium]
MVDKVLHYQIFELNQTPITPMALLMFVLVLLLFLIISRIVTRLFLRRILPKFKIDTGIQFTMRRITHYFIMIVGALVGFQFVGIDLSGLAVIFGLLSVGIGFGLQNITANFISGVILLFERPIKVGDRVTVGNTEGDVTAINPRATTIRTLKNITIIVPNQEFISKNVTNWSHGDPKIRTDLSVGVSYGSDIDTVLRCLREVAAEHKTVLDRPAPDVLLEEFGDSSWNMVLRVWLPGTENLYGIRSELNVAIVRKFRDNGVEIPFPQRDLHLRSPLPLPHTAKGPDEGDMRETA